MHKLFAHFKDPVLFTEKFTCEFDMFFMTAIFVSKDGGESGLPCCAATISWNIHGFPSAPCTDHYTVQIFQLLRDIGAVFYVAVSDYWDFRIF